MNELVHIGIPVTRMPEDAALVPRMGLYRTDPARHPLRIEYLYYLPDSPLPSEVRVRAHAAYRTDDPTAILADGAIPLCEPMPSASGKSIIRFVEKDGMVLELIYENR